MKRATAIDLVLQVPENCASKQAAIYTALRQAMVTGVLAPNQRLPSTREFACALDISRGTAVIVYEMLHAEGYLIARRGTGTFVAPTMPDDRMTMRRTAPESEVLSRNGDERRRGPAEALSPRGCQFDATELLGGKAAYRATPFLPYLPAFLEFPISLWARLTARHARLIKPDLLDQGHAAGWPPLRAAIAGYVRSTRGIDCHSDQIILTSSTPQSLSLCSRLLTERGDHALMEDPGCPLAFAALRAAGLDARLVAADDLGIRIGTESQDGKALLAYVTPAHQRPTGTVMSVERRRALLDWAVQNDGWIFEDDDQSEFRYDGRPVPALCAMDRSGSVLYAGSFDKTLFPALRISYLVVPPSLVDVFARAQAFFGGHPTILSQLVLCDFIESGHFVRHVRRMGECYRDRRAVLIDSLNARFGASIEIRPSPAGLGLAVWWNPGRDAKLVAQMADRAGLRVLPFSSFQIRTPAASGAVLGFAGYDAAMLRRAVELLAVALEASEQRVRTDQNGESACDNLTQQGLGRALSVVLERETDLQVVRG